MSFTTWSTFYPFTTFVTFISLSIWNIFSALKTNVIGPYAQILTSPISELSKNISAQDLAKKINKIFKKTYNELYEIEKNEEIKIARKILKVYKIEEGRGI